MVDAGDLPLLTRAQARGLSIAAFAVLLLIQAGLLLYIRNGLIPPFMGDRYTEANVVRAADFFVHEGFGKTVGLPNVLWSSRFPDAGTVAEPDSLETNNGVYLHYPPVPDLIAGLMARLVGMDKIWIWRLPCIALNLVAMLILTRVLVQVLGIDRAAIFLAILVITPMTWTYMNGLHFQGYASALWLIEFAVLLHAFWIRQGLSRGQAVILAVLGFGQGWLSFDFVFVVVLLPLPLWLMRRAEGVTLDRRSLMVAMLAPLAGFCLAHVLHLVQVAIYFGGLRQAIADYSEVAARRTRGREGKDAAPYFVWLGRAMFDYAFRTAGPNVHYLVWFPIVTGLALLTLMARRIELQMGEGSRSVWIWEVSRRYFVPLIAAVGVSLAWLVVMPQHAQIHYHFVGRHLFPIYFCCIFMLLRCLSRRAVLVSQPAESPPLERA